jgi:16S rRNA C967 or C1407 C5-methylase (RsmB/RsmF family)/NOL1/NOP2/fmu family ribosome biogenesis protein
MNHSFPEAFENRVKNDPFLGSDLLDALDQMPPVTVRFHPHKHRPVLEIIGEVPWCEHAVYLKERPLFTLDPLFHAGAYYPQEAGSMVLDSVLKQLNLPDDPKVLDLCAAPGGKSTLIASFLDGNGLLVSNEVIQARARILKENMTKWGYTNTIVTNNDPRDFERLPQFFDLIVVDAPCSGEGMFRKDPNAREEWSPENVDLCAGRQKRIVADVWEALTPGGILIYSTCTFNRQENEDNVNWFIQELGAELIALSFPDTIINGRDNIGHYCIPGRTESEGFFIAVLQKGEEDPVRQRYTRKSEFRRQKDLLDLGEYANLSEISVINWNEKLLALPAHLEDQMLHVQAQMRLQKMGTTLGEASRKGVIPGEELVLDPFLLSYQKRIDVDRQQALKFLHGDTFTLEGTQGYRIITFQEEPLGWIKHLGNRFNNLYPKDWRIRMNVE